MNRYPLWKYVLIFACVLLGFLYTLPNFFGEVPGLQISSSKTSFKLNLSTLEKVERTLKDSGIPFTHLDFDQQKNPSVRVRFTHTDIQIKARDALQKALNPDVQNQDYLIAMNLMSNSPAWLANLGAHPMFLGLDLRGGVHFLLEVDMKGAMQKKLDVLMNDARILLRDKGLSHAGFEKQARGFLVNLDAASAQDNILNALRDRFAECSFTILQNADGSKNIQAVFTPSSEKDIKENAIKQNIVTLNNRVNELGVAEPIVQQQGDARIIVQLPGVQDTARAKDIIGRTATLEARLASPQNTFIETGTPIPPGMDGYSMGDGRVAIFKKGVIFTGDRINAASVGFDERQSPVVSIKLDALGGRYMREATHDNVGKPMGIILFEKNKAEVLTVATILGELGSDFQITGQSSTEHANDLALLLRAGSLAAPMEIIEERTIGPSLGADNIKKGFHSLVYGFAAIAVFMMLYYGLFGVFSVLALSVNLLLLLGILSLLQATLTLPGIAAIALALGMAIDANVLINERIREELRMGIAPQSAIYGGFKHAWDTILDSNITTLIAGFALLAFGSGPIRGFAVVHCLGILTSMFSAVLFARTLANLYYGSRKKLKSVSIGQVWKPQVDSSNINPDEDMQHSSKEQG